jgi:hypothetical protein
MIHGGERMLLLLVAEILRSTFCLSYPCVAMKNNDSQVQLLSLSIIAICLRYAISCHSVFTIITPTSCITPLLA